MKRKVGVLLAQATTYEKEFYRGVRRAVEDHGDQLIVFNGGHYGSNQVVLGGVSPVYKTALYSCINSFDIDLLVLPITTILQTRMDLVEELTSMFKMPVVLSSQELDGYSSVKYKNQSIGEAVDYMVEAGCKHIAFIGGHSNGNGTQKRFYYYKKALERNGMAYNEDLVIYAHNYTVYNEDIVFPFLKAHPEIDGLVCCTDPLAYCAYRMLKKLKRKIGDDILVVGFDDQPDSKSIHPPLATCRADIFLLGYNVAMHGYHLLETNEPTCLQLDSKLVIRESLSGTIEETFKLNDQGDLNKITQYILEEELYEEHPLVIDLKNLLNAFSLSKYKVNKAIHKLFKNPYYYRMNMANLISVVKENKPEFIEQIVEEYQSRVVVDNNRTADKIITSSETLKRLMQIDFIHDTGEIIDDDFESPVNIKLYTYDKPIRYVCDNHFELPDQLKCVFSLVNNHLNTRNETIKSKDIINQISDDYSIITPICYNEMHYGIMVSDIDYSNLDLIDMMISGISSLIHSNELLYQLNGVAIHDPMTNLFNMRGFNQYIHNMKIEDLNYDLYVCDLNNLKMINDTYGHQFGNIAIMGATEILQKTFPNGIIARFGGDEFVVAAHHDENRDELLIKNTNDYNEKHSYPFDVTFAFGSESWNLDLDIFQQTMSKADAKMYVMKKEYKMKKHEE